MTIQTEVVTGKALANRILTHDGDLEAFDDSPVFDEHGMKREGIDEKHFILTWENHCVSKHLGDSVINGPFDSLESAQAYLK